jgi:hypothetical protein
MSGAYPGGGHLRGASVVSGHTHKACQGRILAHLAKVAKKNFYNSGQR